jgi:hypothetical protein
MKENEEQNGPTETKKEKLRHDFNSTLEGDRLLCGSRFYFHSISHRLRINHDDVSCKMLV